MKLMVEMRESSVLGHLLFSKLEDEGEQRTFSAFLYSGYFLSLFVTLTLMNTANRQVLLEVFQGDTLKHSF